MNSEELLTYALDAIEQREARLLVWGIVDGRLTQQELDALLDPMLDDALSKGCDDFISSDEMIRALQDRSLLFPIDSPPYPGFRSRMAETIRLLFRLRQLFPKNADIDGWQAAPTLVADFRFNWRRRRYPRRDTPAERLQQTVHEQITDPVVDQTLAGLLQGRGPEFQLAAFQLRASQRILQHLQQRRTSGTLVSAGTGSGKTLAFYLPAMTRIGSLIKRNPTERSWVKVLAIYPRTELLRDQFAEVYREARRLDAVLPHGRKLRIGALFGATPKSTPYYWHQDARGRVCVYMGCPEPGCDGDLLWLHEDIQQQRETLVCKDCGHHIPEGEILLTRQSMAKSPPDILFTTTEMLNQQLSNNYSQKLFGIGSYAVRPPEIVLLDEVHTYAGNHGAQVAYLLRRWRQAVGHAPVSFIGLSATLRDGLRFFTSLTGLEPHRIAEIAPTETEMISEGAEYLLALRNDPTSRTAVLSTTIQTLMLLTRSLDHADGKPAGGRYGSRLFAFTDNLDVANRLYFGLLDAEGRNSFQQPDHEPLARLRQVQHSMPRELAGQNWWLAEQLEHRLGDRKHIGRTSSQDPGVVRNLDVIVATASLEVGFNDPCVGGVIQHKAPRDPAQFLQRRGRAGRTRAMRPWTVVVLSDYGRDRSAYQGYDQLFDPELKLRHLPIASRYIQKMQAVYTLIDYLATQVTLNPPYHVWRSLAEPSTEKNRPVLTGKLVEILEQDEVQQEFRDYLRQALQLSEGDIDALLWNYPRPLLSTVIPTAVRRLSSNWRNHGQEQADNIASNNPLPEFIPATLFGDLNLPEVVVDIPSTGNSDNTTSHSMPIHQALKEFAPGRVSRRFGVQHGYQRHWIGNADIDSTEQQIDLAEHYQTEFLGEWTRYDPDGAAPIRVYRPHRISPATPPQAITDTANAQLTWQTEIATAKAGMRLVVPAHCHWQQLLPEIETFRHLDHSQAEFRRFASQSQATLARKDGQQSYVQFSFGIQGQSVALGYSSSVDALRLRLQFPAAIWKQVATDPQLTRALRTEYYFAAVQSRATLPQVENPFHRQRLAEVWFSALTQEALDRQCSLQQAAAALVSGQAKLGLRKVLNSLFQTTIGDGDDESADLQADPDRATDRLRQDIEALLADGTVSAALRDHAAVLWQQIDASWEARLRDRFLATIATAAYTAIVDLCPEVDAEGLLVDTDPATDTDTGFADIWISEASPGGTGAIEDFCDRYLEQSGRFFSLLDAALAPNDHCLADSQLELLLATLGGDEDDPDLEATVDAFRVAADSHAMEKHLADMRKQLRERDYTLFHGFLVAISNRILRPGGSQFSDRFLHRALQNWQQEEQRLEVELDPRSIAFHLSRDDAIDQVVREVGLSPPIGNGLQTWRFNAIYGLLWRRGRDLRGAGLECYNPFVNLGAVEPLLIRPWLTIPGHRIAIDRPDWQNEALQRLAERGTVTLYAPAPDKTGLAKALHFFATNPVESDYLSVYARAASLRLSGFEIELDLEVEEFLS